MEAEQNRSNSPESEQHLAAVETGLLDGTIGATSLDELLAQTQQDITRIGEQPDQIS